MKNVVVTGASSGIGAATARLLLERGYRVFATYRSLADAPASPNLHPILMDLERSNSIDSGASEIAAHLGEEPLAGLVNNAGIGVPGPAAEQPLDDFRAHFMVNVIGVHQLTRALLPALGLGKQDRPAGRIVNISSVSGRVALPFTTAYTASKFALEGYSAALRRELSGTGIDVLMIAPGMVRTPIWSKAGMAMERYRDSPFRAPLERLVAIMTERAKKGDRPERIAAAIVEALTSRRPAVRRGIVAGRFQNETLPRILPARIVDALLARQLGPGPGAG